VEVAAQLVRMNSLVTRACGTDALSVVAPPRAITAVVLDRVPDRERIYPPITA
jgi:hypothetical protein